MPAASTLALIAAGMAAVGSIQAGQAAKAQSEFQAAVGEQQAARERLIGVRIAAGEEKDFRRQQSALLAERRAALGKSGIDIGRGTPLLAASDFAAETELQAQRIRAGGETQAARLEQQAAQQAVLLRAGGKAAQQRGLFRAGSSLLSGYGEWSDRPKKKTNYGPGSGYSPDYGYGGD